MNSEKENLRKRELEIQRLMRQMKFDELHKSQVYRNLEQELQKIKQNNDILAEQETPTSTVYTSNQQK
ncbi:hypothetical protein SanaruYs_35870 [Chryseotalea sanaruensis]|jgi:hypothetical protein|uniref:Uncharacterized protein n=1 Tax=Chryseotalea sanaruensis TaxID=2482724 RepID=A0A401UES0_9BACT|nr:hypothetical protein [Chryseotalea sanaruensis]GCC53344.1 hypothetical protein SanaruYs_35870 [Chryseotalea sanaruensis]